MCISGAPAARLCYLARMEHDRRDRCAWAMQVSSPLETAYHDQEWGVPSRNDQHLFEMLVLEGAQAGLSWSTILHKRLGYREAFDGFDPERVAAFGPGKIGKILENPGVVRNRRKIEAAVAGAQAFLRVQAEVGSFTAFLWSFVGYRPVQNYFVRSTEIPPLTPLSALLSKVLRERGFRFVGPTICYAFMQAVGLVNDHTIDCFRHQEIVALDVEYHA